MKFISFAPVLGVALVIASHSMAPAKETGLAPSQKLAKALSGRTAGPAVNCISNFRGNDQMEIIDDSTLLFREGNIIYLQRLKGSCRHIGKARNSLVTRQYGSQKLCAGDINQVIDLTTGAEAGSCAFGPFIPYHKVERRDN